MPFTKRTVPLMLVAVFIAALILLAIFTPLSQPRIPFNQRRAVQSIADLNMAERNHATQHPDAGYACKLSDLGEEGFVDKVLASGTKSWYHFEIQCAKNDGQKVTGYTITAVPVIPGTTGKYALCTDQGAEIWYSENGSASDCLATRKPIERKYRPGGT